MRSKPKSLMALACLATMLSSCASSGPASLPELRVDLPPVPADLKICFHRKIGIPAPEAMTKRQVTALIASLKNSADDKDRCGTRLVCWYEDIAAGFAQDKTAPARAPECAKG